MAKNGLRAIFEPKSVLLFGDSKLEEKRKILAPSLLESIAKNMSSYKGKTYILDLSGKLPGSFKRFRDIPKKPDLCVLTLPLGLSLKYMRQLAKTGIKAMVAIGDDYKPKQLEDFVKATVKRGVRVLGPNAGLGVLNTANGLWTSFERDVMPRRGKIALISQSSDVGAAMLDWASFNGVEMNKFASLGEKADVDEVDLIGYLMQDKDTKVICIYMERIEKGQRLVEVMREAVKHKPVCVLKGAVNVRVGERDLSISLRRDQIFDAALKKSDVIRAYAIDHLFEIATALSKQPPLLGNRVAIISNANGPAILASDAIQRESLELANFRGETVKKITGKYRDMKVVNPLNILTDAKADRCGFVLREVLQDPEVDGAIVINMLKTCLLEPGDTKVVAEVAKKTPSKPVIDVSIGGEDYALVSDELRETHIPVYNLPEKAARALKALYTYGQIRQRITTEGK